MLRDMIIITLIINLHLHQCIILKDVAGGNLINQFHEIYQTEYKDLYYLYLTINLIVIIVINITSSTAS